MEWKGIQKQAAVTFNRLEAAMFKETNMSVFSKWQMKKHESCLYHKH